jgi:hypothetical protein
MASLPLHDGEQPSVNRRWVWALRIITILLLAVSLGHIAILTLVGGGYSVARFVSMTSLGFFGLFALVLWGLRSNHPRRFAVGLTIGLGSFWVLPSVVFADTGATILFERDLPSSVQFLAVSSLWVLTVIQGFYAVVGVIVFRSMTGGRGYALKVVGAIGAGLVLSFLGLVMVRLKYGDADPFPTPVRSLRTINTAEITYASTYEGGYS